MELVYLWVEEYKNIHRQGFNFSPRFESEVFEDEENNTYELVICDKEKGECLDKDTKKCKPCKDNGYIKDFFGDNINITAIVGKNGSGKSSILEFIYQYISNRLYDKKYIFLIKINNEINYFSTCNIRTNTKVYQEVLSFRKSSLLLNNANSIFIDFSFDYKKNLSKQNNGLFYPDKNESINQIIKSNALLLKKNIITNKLNKNVYFYPSFIIIKHNNINIYQNFFNKIENHLLEWLESKIKKLEWHKYNGVLKNKLEIFKLSILIELLKTIVKYKYFDLNKSYTREISYELLYEQIKVETKELSSNLPKGNIKTIEITEKDNILKRLNSLLKDYDFFNNEDNNLENYIDIKYSNINTGSIEIAFQLDQNIQDKLLKLPEFYEYNYLDIQNNKKYSDLSTGEKIFFVMNAIIEKYSRNEIQNYFILLDEPLNSFHPNWQKNFIDYLLSLYPHHNRKYHFIITSHSPFLLSDIPKQNIIFLDTDEEGNCKVVDGLNKKKRHLEQISIHY